MRTIYLHIGTEKTGTSSIQAVASANKDLMHEAGILYPTTPGNPNHVRLALFASSKPTVKDLQKAHNLFDPASYLAFKGDFLPLLSAEITNSGCSKILLSNEHLSSRVKDPSDITAFIRTLQSLGTVKIIIYLRDQHDLMLSAYSTAIKSGGVRELSLPDRSNPYYNYELLLAPWVAAAGQDNLIVRLFKPLPVGIVDDFFHILRFVPPKPALIRNNSLDARSIKFLLRINTFLPKFVHDTLNIDRSDIVTALEATSNGPKLKMSPDMRAEVNSLFAASNAVVARRYFGRRDGILFPALEAKHSDYAETDLTVDDAIEIAAQIWTWKQRQLAAVGTKASAGPRIEHGRVVRKIWRS